MMVYWVYYECMHTPRLIENVGLGVSCLHWKGGSIISLLCFFRKVPDLWRNGNNNGIHLKGEGWMITHSSGMKPVRSQHAGNTIDDKQEEEDYDLSWSYLY